MTNITNSQVAQLLKSSRPTKRDRRSLAQHDFAIDLGLKTITPIMGGGAEARKVDTKQTIRVASIRGQLRMWWRALTCHTFSTSAEMQKAEAELWGGQQGRNAMLASAVAVSVKNIANAFVERDNVTWKDKHFYATWPAQSFGGGNPAERWKEGLTFDLRLTGPTKYKEVLQDTLKAWILFGGYGGRVRRGMGAITISDPEIAKQWLPSNGSLNSIKSIFSTLPDWLDHQGVNQTETPSLYGAGLAIKETPKTNPMSLWLEAVTWLNEFRQGQPQGGRSIEGAQKSNYARLGAGDITRPSISNWPEPDKIRRLTPPARGKEYTHPPRPEHNKTPVWPRASFGLPIQIQFQKMDRNRNRNAYTEPGNVTLNIDGKMEGRLASPLIIKAIAIGDGTQFVACALWLNRQFPDDKLGPALTRGHNTMGRWDVLCAPGDEILYSPLKSGVDAPRGKRLRTAFMTWLKGKNLNVSI